MYQCYHCIVTVIAVFLYRLQSKTIHNRSELDPIADIVDSLGDMDLLNFLLQDRIFLSVSLDTMP